MIKRFKNVSYKTSIMTVLLFTITTPFVFTDYVTVNAVQGEMSTIESSGQFTKDQHNFIIDALVKNYDDIIKLEQVSDFKFKVPDIIPDGSKVTAFQLRKLSEKCNGIEIFFENSNGIFTFQIFQGDPIESLRKIESDKTKAIENTQVDIKKEPLKIGGITGLNVTLATTFPDREVGNNDLGNSNFKESQKITKYYVWQNEGFWYSIEYNSQSKSNDTNNILVDLSQSDILQIAQSIRYPEEVKDTNYSIIKDTLTEAPVINIYDKEDLEKAKSFLGFNPKFPLEINKELTIISSIVRISDAPHKEKDKVNYEIDNFYNNRNGSITFTQGKSSKDYEGIGRNVNLIEVGNENSQIKPEKLVINNIDVFKYSSRDIVPQISYIWKENDIYYSLSFFVNIQNSDEIVGTFINSKLL